MSNLDIIAEQIKSEISVDIDGKGFASIRGTARIVSIGESTLREAFKGARKTGTKMIEMLVQYGFDPRGFSEKGVPDGAVALIAKYYAWMAGSRCTDQAKQADMLFSAIGARVWMQQLTGWTSQRENVRYMLRDVVSREPLPWESHFCKDWIKNAERLTGWKWEYRVMSKFINKHVYDYMPIEVRQILDEVNPMDKSGQRPSKQHQHFTEEAAPILKSHIATVLDLMRASVSINQFEDLMRARFDNVYQLRFEAVLIDRSGKIC